MRASASLWLVLSLLTAGAAPAGGPYAAVPEQHWAYDAVRQLAQLGLFTGYPDGTFSGKRPLTRYVFAVATQRMLTEVYRERAAGLRPVNSVRVPLQKLVQEFAAELTMLGSDADELRALLQPGSGSGPFIFGEAWRRLAPDLAGALPGVYPGILEAAGTAAWNRGVRLAGTEWHGGQVVYYTCRLSGGGVSATNGITYRPYGPPASDSGTLALIAGHNAEVNRRVAEFGVPASSRLSWVESILRPESVWAGNARPIKLSAVHPDAISPDARVLLHLHLPDEGGRCVLRVSLPERTSELSLPAAEAGGQVRVLWGEPGADLLFVASGRGDKPGESEPRVVDLRSGEFLR